MILQAKDLRIGNLVDRGDYTCEIISISKEGLMTQPIDYKGENSSELVIQPIPISEEWLLKLGFKKEKYSDLLPDGFTEYTIGRFEFTIDETNNSNYFWIVDTDEGNYSVECNYVHELQNLYFALTKKEL